MRPQSIIWFEGLYLASVAIALINTMVNFNQIVDYLAASGVGTASLIVGILGGFLGNFLLWFFIARRASNTAKWIFVMMTVLGWVFIRWKTGQFVGNASIHSVPAGLSKLLQLAAVIPLFRRDAMEWFKSKGAREPIDASTFN
jgi:hypothetical protein